MLSSWDELVRIAEGSGMVVERVRLRDRGVTVEGGFEPPPLAALSEQDQVFIVAFLQCHGSIKAMERMFGVSYPTVKNRLNRINERLDFVDYSPPPVAEDVLDRLARGEIDVEQALELLQR